MSPELHTLFYHGGQMVRQCGRIGEKTRKAHGKTFHPLRLAHAAGEAISAVSLFIDLPAVGDAGDAHQLAVVINDVHDAEIADADAPEILVTV